MVEKGRFSKEKWLINVVHALCVKTMVNSFHFPNQSHVAYRDMNLVPPLGPL